MRKFLFSLLLVIMPAISLAEIYIGDDVTWEDFYSAYQDLKAQCPPDTAPNNFSVTMVDGWLFVATGWLTCDTCTIGDCFYGSPWQGEYNGGAGTPPQTPVYDPTGPAWDSVSLDTSPEPATPTIQSLRYAFEQSQRRDSDTLWHINSRFNTNEYLHGVTRDNIWHFSNQILGGLNLVRDDLRTRFTEQNLMLDTMYDEMATYQQVYNTNENVSWWGQSISNILSNHNQTNIATHNRLSDMQGVQTQMAYDLNFATSMTNDIQNKINLLLGQCTNWGWDGTCIEYENVGGGSVDLTGLEQSLQGLQMEMGLQTAVLYSQLLGFDELCLDVNMQTGECDHSFPISPNELNALPQSQLDQIQNMITSAIGSGTGGGGGISEDFAAGLIGDYSGDDYSDSEAEEILGTGGLSIGDLEGDTISLDSFTQQYFSFGSAQCYAPLSINLSVFGVQNTIEIDLTPLCTLFGFVGVLLFIASNLLAIRIVVGAF